MGANENTNYLYGLIKIRFYFELKHMGSNPNAKKKKKKKNPKFHEGQLSKRQNIRREEV